MSIAAYLKAPGATLDFGNDWGSWLHAGETITASTWAASGTGLIVAGSSVASGTAIAWLSGGTVGTTYTVANRITTSQGRTDERTFTVQVVAR